MTLVCAISAEEEVACQLADLAVQLHKRGLVGPYQHVVKARDVLLLALDGGKKRSIGRKKITKNKDAHIYAIQA